MDGSKAGSDNIKALGLDAMTKEEYVYQSQLLQEFAEISSIDEAWIFKSDSTLGSRGIFSIIQPNFLANTERKLILSSNIVKESSGSVKFQWAPFPIDTFGVSIIVPSPSGSKLLVVRNPEIEGPSHFEIWSSSQVEKEFQIPQSVHGSVYTDEWFEGISWNVDETFIAYVAEEPAPKKHTFNDLFCKKGGFAEEDCNSWEGEGQFEEDLEDTHDGMRQPALFLININSGEVQAFRVINECLSVGQVVWSPSTEGSEQYLVFVGWSIETRNLGIKYCYDRPCALYAVRGPNHGSKPNEPKFNRSSTKNVQAINLTRTEGSAFCPCFSPDGKFLVFLSAKCSVDSGAHIATNSLHRIDWPTDMKLFQSTEVHDVVPVVMCAEDGCFPGLYCSSIHSNPWLSDGCTLIVSSYWHSNKVLLSVNVLSGEILRISPADSNFSWRLLALDGDNIVAVSSSPVDVPQIKYGTIMEKATKNKEWDWLDISSSIFKCSDKVRSLLSSLHFSIMKIPVVDASDSLTKGASKPYEAILVSSKTRKNNSCDPLIVEFHGKPHDVSLSQFSKNCALACSLGNSVLAVNYRGSSGFGEEALQSLQGEEGFQDVDDIVAAIDHVINLGLANPLNIRIL